MSGVVRWTFFDVETSESVVLPLNPNEMSSPTFQRSTKSAWTSRFSARGTAGGGNGAEPDNGRGRPRLFDSGPSSPTDFTFSGIIQSEAHYELLLEWAKRCNLLRVTDHLGRTFEMIIQRFEPVEQRPTATNLWKMHYTMSCLLLKVVS